MDKSIFNKNGMSLAYTVVGIALLGIVSVMLLNITHSQQMSDIHHANSVSARSAVHSGFTQALKFFETEDSTSQENVLSLLQTWIDSSSISDIPETRQWLVGDGDTYEQIDDNTQFRVRMRAFDADNKTITLFSEGIGRGGARASAMGVYRLDGLDIETETGVIATNALYLGSGADEVNAELIVNGDVFMRETGTFYVGGHTFNGNFRRNAEGGSGELYLKNTTFNGPAYFRGAEVLFEGGRSFFNNGFGGDAEFAVSGSNGPYVDEPGAYFNSSFKFVGGTWNGDMRFYNNAELMGVTPEDNYSTGGGANTGLDKLYSAGTSDGFKPSNDPGQLVTGPLDVISLLDIPENDPPLLEADLEEVRKHPYIITYEPGSTLPGIGENSNLTGADLTNLYNNNADKYFKDEWIIVNLRLGNGARPFESGGDGFRGKMILLVEDDDLEINNNLFESSLSSNTFIYVGGKRQIDGMGGADLFRGFVFNNSTHSGSNNNSSVIMRTEGGPMEIRGSVYCVNVGRYRMEGNHPFTISYDAAVLEELADLGIVVEDDDDDDDDEDLIIVDDHLRGVLLSRSY
ncbi:MAG: hypothetical protein ACQEQ4_06250 [Fibrobacterota bacterium]